MTPSGPAPVRLWRLGTKECRLSNRDTPAPFIVELYDGDTLTSRQTFINHDAATAVAVEALRVASLAAV